MRFISHDSRLMSFNLCLEVNGTMRLHTDLGCRAAQFQTSTLIDWTQPSVMMLNQHNEQRQLGLNSPCIPVCDFLLVSSYISMLKINVWILNWVLNYKVCTLTLLKKNIIKWKRNSTLPQKEARCFWCLN